MNREEGNDVLGTSRLRELVSLAGVETLLANGEGSSILNWCVHALSVKNPESVGLRSSGAAVRSPHACLSQAASVRVS